MNNKERIWWVKAIIVLIPLSFVWILFATLGEIFTAIAEDIDNFLDRNARWNQKF